MTYDDKVAEFKARIDAGEKIEAGDWMPDEYRLSALKFIEMHANSPSVSGSPALPR
jgi:ring-1,2-phenylacetyl-CoA epoxidase subunit PaaA